MVMNCSNGTPDCQGVCDGSAEVDQCGVCNGNGVCDDMAISQMGSNLPEEFSILQNYPNPFNPVTHIEYNIAQYSRVMIRIFDMGGRLITELYNGNQVPGRYEITWNARQFTSGMYLLELMSLSNQNNLNFRDVKKILYLK